MKISERYYKKIAGEIDFNTIEMNDILVQLEVTNACNHRCCFCPNQNSIRKTKMMDYEFAQRMIRECKDIIGENSKICFHMNGEPLLYQRLPELISLSKNVGYEYCFITTNGSVASNELLERLFEAGLDSIKFSINAGTEETYKHIHGKDDFNKVVNALMFASEYRRSNNSNFKIYVSCVGIKENKAELEQLKNKVSPYCDEILFYYPCGYAGQNNKLARELRCDLCDLDIETFEIKHQCPCNVLWNSINITCDGYLSLCCSESDNRLIIEDLNKKSVKDAWFGDKMNRIREKHMKNDIEDTPCYSCVHETMYIEEKINSEIFELSFDVRNSLKRVKKAIENIDYGDTKDFFKNRASKYNENNPYSVTMYQDSNPELVIKRNESEVEKLKPFLGLNEKSSVLDIACGIGRWSDAIDEKIYEYCGIDFSQELIDIAKKRNHHLNREFYVGTANDVKRVLIENNKGKYNTILLIGILMYLNDRDLIDALEQIESVSEENTVICIREPVGIEDRLTLKNFYSSELNDNYNAIYRTRNELIEFFEKTLFLKKFEIIEEGYVFERNELNNRRETEQYYFIIRR